MKIKLLFTSLACLIVFTMGSCSSEEPFSTETGKKELSPTDDEGTVPLIVRTDPEPVSISSGKVTMRGHVENRGGSNLRLAGFVYSDQTDMPTLQDSRVYIFSPPDIFEREISRLTDGVEYSIRAYVINQTDTAYGDPVKITPYSVPSKVITLPVVNRVRLGAIVCGQFEEEGDIKEYGVCLSRNANPTIDDFREIAHDIDTLDVIGCFGVFFDDLEPETMYHVRAYAIQNDDKVVYGNDRIFQTTKGGNFSKTFWNGDWCLSEDPAAYARINEAMDSAFYYYINYSNLTKHINYNYSPGTPTADCNIEGWMNFGSNARYQWVGTAQHEISHAIGVGTASNWGSMFTGGIWNKPRATQALRVMMKDMHEKINLSGVHFWPGGINQREEVTDGTRNSHGEWIKNERMLKLNAIVLNAMREDGLSSY